MKRIIACLAALALLCPAGVPAQVDPGEVTIARDSLGVPHVFGKTDAATAYGLAWAHAEDNFRDIETVLLAGKGMLGKAIGKKGAQADYVASLLRCRDMVREKQGQLSPEFLRVVSAYVQGINDYASAHPREIRVRDAFPATVEDYLTTATLSLSMISGLEDLLPAIYAGNIAVLPGFSPAGSNAIAIHPSKTTTGEAFLAINSHQPLEGPVAWYEAHLQSDEGLNIIGGLFPGGLCIFHGTNEHLGWAHTVNNMDKVDVYQLKMKPGKSTEYMFDGQWEKLEVRKVKLRVKGVPVPVTRKTYWSKYGAAIRTDKGMFAVRFVANQEIHGLEQWWRMNKARNFSEFYRALSMQGLPMFNIVYADRYDTIFYISGGRMPIRNKSYHWRGTLPGDSSATLWNSFHPIGDLPQYLNPTGGYLFNTNHSPFHASDPKNDLDPGRYDPTSGYETYDNNRSARFAELMADRQLLDYETFKKIKYDNQLPMTFRYKVNLDSIGTMEPTDFPDISMLITTMRQWNLESDTSSQGAALFRLLYEYVTGHRHDFPNDTLTVAGAVAAFRFARQHQVQYFGRTGITLGELQRHKRGNRSLPAWGLPDVLTAMYSRMEADGRFRVVAGESYIQLVRFPKNGLPVIESVNCYGASTHPDSPHYTDQMNMFIAQKTRPISLDKETVLKNAMRVYHPGQ